MSDLGFHLVFRARDSRVLAVDAAARRMLASTTHDVGERFGLYAFRAAGDHLHAGALCGRDEAARFAQALGSALTQRLGIGVGFGPAHLEPLAGQRHLERTFRYVHRNSEKHGVGNDPLHEASALQALLGMRLPPGGFISRVRSAVPKVGRDELLELIGVRELEPRLAIDHLADAAAGAVGLAVLDRSALSARARAAAARVALAEVGVARVAEALGVGERAIRSFRARQADPLLERAIGLRMGHRLALGDRARLDLPLDTARL